MSINVKTLNLTLSDSTVNYSSVMHDYADKANAENMVLPLDITVPLFYASLANDL